MYVYSYNSLHVWHANVFTLRGNGMVKAQSETVPNSAPVQKNKGGRPGRQVTRENFFSVLTYFGKKYKWDEDLDEIQRDAPHETQTPEAISELIATEEAMLKRAIERGDLTGTYGADTHEEKLKFLRSRPAKPVTDTHIARLQEWVLNRVDKKGWARACSAIRQNKLKEKRGHFATAQIPVRRETKWKLDRLKEKLGATDWSETFEKLIELAQEGMKTLEARKRAAETRKRNSASRRRY